jgi:signal peptidase II
MHQVQRGVKLMKKELVLCGILIVLDQLTKFLVDKFINYASFVNIIPFYDFFNITNIRNSGMAFGMFQGKNFLFSLLIILLLFILSVWLYDSWNGIRKIQRYAACLIIAGGVGNLTDRLLRGSVVDFLDFGINRLRWPTFNIADSCVFIAVFIIFAEILTPNKWR